MSPPITLTPIVGAHPDCDVPDGGTGVPVTLNEGGDTVPFVQTGPGIQLQAFTTEGDFCQPPTEILPLPGTPPPSASALISLGNRVYQLHHFMRVPAQGSLYLFCGRVNTGAVAIPINQNFVFRGASVSFDVVDPANDYRLELLLSTGAGYSVAESIAIPAGELGGFSTSFDVEGDAGNGVGARLVRTGGTGKSTFHLMTVSLELRDR